MNKNECNKLLCELSARIGGATGAAFALQYADDTNTVKIAEALQIQLRATQELIGQLIANVNEGD
jgi:uncharacterized lipoprotein YehR (DUF1307 family)